MSGSAGSIHSALDLQANWRLVAGDRKHAGGSVRAFGLGTGGRL